jgi:hypothetical protein
MVAQMWPQLVMEWNNDILPTCKEDLVSTTLRAECPDQNGQVNGVFDPRNCDVLAVLRPAAWPARLVRARTGRKPGWVRGQRRRRDLPARDPWVPGRVHRAGARDHVPAAFTGDGINYYNHALVANGGIHNTDSFFRYFLAPGQGTAALQDREALPRPTQCSRSSTGSRMARHPTSWKQAARSTASP